MSKEIKEFIEAYDAWVRVNANGRRNFTSAVDEYDSKRDAKRRMENARKAIKEV